CGVGVVGGSGAGMGCGRARTESRSAVTGSRCALTGSRSERASGSSELSTGRTRLSCGVWSIGSARGRGRRRGCIGEGCTADRRGGACGSLLPGQHGRRLTRGGAASLRFRVDGNASGLAHGRFSVILPFRGCAAGILTSAGACLSRSPSPARVFSWTARRGTRQGLGVTQQGLEGKKVEDL